MTWHQFKSVFFNLPHASEEDEFMLQLYSSLSIVQSSFRLPQLWHISISPYFAKSPFQNGNPSEETENINAG